MVEMECDVIIGAAASADTATAAGDAFVVVIVGGVVATDGSKRLINTDGTTDTRPNIGSNRSRMESRGLIWPELLPLDSKKSKSFGFKITAKKRAKIEIRLYKMK